MKERKKEEEETENERKKKFWWGSVISMQQVQNRVGPVEQYQLSEPWSPQNHTLAITTPDFCSTLDPVSTPEPLATSVPTWLFSMRAVPSALWFWSATSFQYSSVGGGGRSEEQGGGGAGSGGDPKAGGSIDGERQDRKDETSQGEKGKSPSVRGGDIKEEESERKR